MFMLFLIFQAFDLLAFEHIAGSERADGVREVPGRRPKDVREVSGSRPGGGREGPGERLELTLLAFGGRRRGQRTHNGDSARGCLTFSTRTVKLP